MAIKSFTFFFALAALLAVSLANASNDDSSNNISAAAIQPTERQPIPVRRHYPARCYRRIQTCCYKYIPCGIKCKLLRCYKIRKCVLKNPFTKKCLKYKWVKICIKKCYKKLCKRFRCSPFRVAKSRIFIAPKPFKYGKSYIVKK